MKMNSFVRDRSNGRYTTPLAAFLICHWIRTLRALMSSALGSVAYTTTDRSYATSGWQIEEM